MSKNVTDSQAKRVKFGQTNAAHVNGAGGFVSRDELLNKHFVILGATVGESTLSRGKKEARIRLVLADQYENGYTDEEVMTFTPSGNRIVAQVESLIADNSFPVDCTLRECTWATATYQKFGVYPVELADVSDEPGVPF